MKFWTCFSGYLVCLFGLMGPCVLPTPAADYILGGSFAAGQFPIALATGDFNRDGRPDVAVANQGSGDVSILLCNGDGTFQAATNYPAGLNPPAIAVADFNHDGKLDLAVANQSNPGSVSILLGNGDGTFQAATNYPAGTDPSSIAIGDFNYDGILDLATGNATDPVSV